MGIREVYHKSIFVPTAHDEPYIYFNIYKDIFHKSRAIIYLTEKEKKFVEKQFMNHNVPNEVAAVGVSIPEIVDAYAFQREKGLTDYIIYVGRIDEAKGCITLFDYFTQYKKRYPGSLKLVLMGKPVLPIPEDQDIISLGFVDEEEKVKGIAGAVALVLPSQYESLSLSVLEAFSLGTPVIVNGKCEVLLDHCVKSNAGLYYEDYWEFEGCIQYMLTHKEECQIMSDNAIEYIQDNYQWKVIDEKWNRFMENIE
jgi:glycosyltransferase involved in cell wall biosynthesis